MSSTIYAPTRLTAKRNCPTNRQAQAWRALDAMTHGLHALDAGLLYGFTQEELAACRPAWEHSRNNRL